jgi:hypothetical protein
VIDEFEVNDPDTAMEGPENIHEIDVMRHSVAR